ncbi:MAG: hypothetical protein JOZ21_08015 [Verrucomicrobia bacterium]|nr:hypothetical protein [Verrucomicrobiota bacterium]
MTYKTARAPIQARGVQRLNKLTKFILMGPSLWLHTIARMRTVEAVWAVTPIVSQTAGLNAGRYILIVKGHHWQ